MPDVNTEVELDFDMLPREEFKKKLEAITGSIKCMLKIHKLPSETIIEMKVLTGL